MYVYLCNIYKQSHFFFLVRTEDIPLESSLPSPSSPVTVCSGLHPWSSSPLPPLPFAIDDDEDKIISVSARLDRNDVFYLNRQFCGYLSTSIQDIFFFVYLLLVYVFCLSGFFWCFFFYVFILK